MPSLPLETSPQDRVFELLRNSPHALETLVGTCFDSFWVLDFATGIQWLSPGFWQRTGHAPREGSDIAPLIRQVLSEEDHEVLVRTAWAHLTDPGAPFDLETRLAHADGSQLWARLRGQLIQDAEGNPTCLIVVVHDISELKNSEQILIEHAFQLEEAQHAAESASRTKSEFLAHMSHEMRTPLNAVIGLTEAMLMTSMAPEQQAHLRIVRNSAGSLRRIIDDVLDLSRIEAGGLTLEIEEFSPRETVFSTIESLKFAASQKGVELRCFVSLDVPAHLMGDAGRLRQILVNLSGNAIKFTEAGEITVRVNAEEKQGRTRLHVSVQDSGCGIDPEELERLFLPFEQLDPSTTRRHGGTGLGLAISRRLLELMEGNLWAESEPGEGSCFHFEAMFESVAHASFRPHVPGLQLPRAAELPRLRILLVEDCIDNQIVARALLGKDRHEIVTANDGAEGLALATSQEFDVILMDIEMPVMDGFEATRAIREAEGDSEHPVPIVAMTAHVMPEMRPRCAELGMAGYVPKPIDRKQLIDTLWEVISPDA